MYNVCTETEIQTKPIKMQATQHERINLPGGIPPSRRQDDQIEYYKNLVYFIISI